MPFTNAHGCDCCSCSESIVTSYANQIVIKKAFPYKTLTFVRCQVGVELSNLSEISSPENAGTVCGWMPSTVGPFNFGGKDEVGNTSIL